MQVPSTVAFGLEFNTSTVFMGGGDRPSGPYPVLPRVSTLWFFRVFGEPVSNRTLIGRMNANPYLRDRQTRPRPTQFFSCTTFPAEAILPHQPTKEWYRKVPRSVRHGIEKTFAYELFANQKRSALSTPCATHRRCPMTLPEVGHAFSCARQNVCAPSRGDTAAYTRYTLMRSVLASSPGRGHGINSTTR